MRQRTWPQSYLGAMQPSTWGAKLKGLPSRSLPSPARLQAGSTKIVQSARRFSKSFRDLGTGKVCPPPPHTLYAAKAGALPGAGWRWRKSCVGICGLLRCFTPSRAPVLRNGAFFKHPICPPKRNCHTQPRNGKYRCTKQYNFFPNLDRFVELEQRNGCGLELEGLSVQKPLHAPTRTTRRRPYVRPNTTHPRTH